MTTQLQKFDIAMPVGNIDAYIHHVNSIPMLSAQEEKRLTKELRENNNLEAAKKLVMAHLRFVVKIAKSYMGYGLALADLIQEGNVGLMKAIKRFNPKVGVRLVTFAVHWIKAEIHEFVLRNWRIVKIATTKPQRKLFFNIRKTKKRLGWFSKKEVEYVAKTLNVKPQTVTDMESRLNAYDAAFDSENSDSENNLTPAKVLEDSSQNPALLLEDSDWQLASQNRLSAALAQLDERGQMILHSRWLTKKKATLQELADKYHITAERVRQLEKQALRKLKVLLSDDNG